MKRLAIIILLAGIFLSGCVGTTPYRKPSEESRASYEKYKHDKAQYEILRELRKLNRSRK